MRRDPYPGGRSTPLPLEVGERHGIPRGEGMRVGDDERVRRRGDDLALQRRREPVHGGEQREVDLAALELCDKARRPETGRPQLQHDGRMPRMERSEKARHIDEVDPRHEPDGDGAAQFGAGRRDGLTELAHALEDVPERTSNSSPAPVNLI